MYKRLLKFLIPILIITLSMFLFNMCSNKVKGTEIKANSAKEKMYSDDNLDYEKNTEDSEEEDSTENKEDSEDYDEDYDEDE